MSSDHEKKQNRTAARGSMGRRHFYFLDRREGCAVSCGCSRMALGKPEVRETGLATCKLNCKPIYRAKGQKHLHS